MSNNEVSTKQINNKNPPDDDKGKKCWAIYMMNTEVLKLKLSN